jgi:CheY-like chemotaxis protein
LWHQGGEKEEERNVPKTLLIVEDDEDIQNYYGFLFGRLDLKMVRAFSGEEAIEKVASEPSLDLILLDVVLPGMGGEEFFRILRKEKGVQTPVIVCSVDERMSQRVQEVGEVQGVFTKGTSGDQLVDIISRTLGL